MRHHSRKTQNRRLRNALRYANWRWPILPLFGINDGKCECSDPKCRRPGKHPRTTHGLKDATTNRKQIRRWWKKHPRSNIGILTGPASSLLVLDIDGERGKRAWKKLLSECDCSGINTLAAITGNGRHYFFGYDGTIRNSTGKLSPNIDVRGDGGYVVGAGSTHASGHKYRWENPEHEILPLPKQLLSRLTTDRTTQAVKSADVGTIPRGQRNTTLTSLAGIMRRPGMSRKAIEAALLAENGYRCTPPLPNREVEIIAASVARYMPVSPPCDWPAPIGEAAYHGLAGEIVDVLRQYSEADPIALLSHLLVFTGSAVGNSPHIRVAAERHSGNMFLVVVGDTGRARKGVAFNQTKQLFRLADPQWVDNCIATGLSSGEGVIHAISKQTSLASDGRVPILLLFESEFGLVLRVILRQGNTLSPVLRQLYDCTSSGVLTRNEPLRADTSHISLVGHITRPELKELLSNRDIYGGLANRILWPCVRRQGIHAELGGTPDDVLKPLAKKLGLVIEQAKKRKELTFSTHAKEKWRKIYAALSASESGRFESIVSRPEAQVLRLTVVYSLLDQCAQVDDQHLEAAMALWKYCHASAASIFGGKRSSSLEEELMKMLNTSQQGLTRTEISAAFNNHKSKEVLVEALNKLRESGLVEKAFVKTHGRSAERWYVTRREH